MDFGKFSEESKGMLIPLWLFPFLAEEIKVVSVNSDNHFSVVKKSEIDTDDRMGLLAFSVIPKDKTV